MTRRMRRARVLHVVCEPCGLRSRGFVHVPAAQGARERHRDSRRHARATGGRGVDVIKGGVHLEERFADRQH